MRLALTGALIGIALVVAASVWAGGAQGQQDCATLGQAAKYGAFVNGEYRGRNGTFQTGIAARGDVDVSSIYVQGTSAAPYAVVTGSDFIGRNGSLNGGVSAAGQINVDNSFSIGGPQRPNTPPPFVFTEEFEKLKVLSATWAGLVPNGTDTLSGDQLTLTGPAPSTPSPKQIVFEVDAADLSRARLIYINVTGDLPVLVNVVGTSSVTITPDDVVPNGVTAAKLMWNFPRIAQLDFRHGVAWDGTILAPYAKVTATAGPQLYGTLIAASVSRVDPSTPSYINSYSLVPFTGCLPVASKTLTALCVNPGGNLALRLSNPSDEALGVTWQDLDTGQKETVPDLLPAKRDLFFLVPAASPAHLIRVTSVATDPPPAGSSSQVVRGTTRACSGSIEVTKTVSGPAPDRQTWPIEVTGLGFNGETKTETRTLAANGSFKLDPVAGSYQPGVAQPGQVVGGNIFTIRETDKHGATTSTDTWTVSIVDGNKESVTILNAYPTVTPTPTPTATPTATATATAAPPLPTATPDVEQPVQPSLPPGTPLPLPGPDLIIAPPGGPAADVTVTNRIVPSELLVGGQIRTLIRVRNLGPLSAVGTVVREVPQFRPLESNRVARVLSVTASKGRCTNVRPVRCALGTLAPGEEVVVRARVRVLVANALRSVVVVTSTTPDSNATNNADVAGVVTRRRPAAISAGISAPATGRVGLRFSYRVTATGRGSEGASFVRLCAPPTETITEVQAPGTFRYRGARCRDYRRVGRGTTVGFTLSGVPAANGRLPLSARANALDLARAARASARVLVGGAPCPARARRPLC